MAYPTRLLCNLIPGRETFSICQIGVPFWFQSEEKPGPAVSRTPGCPPPLNGCLHLPLVVRVLGLTCVVPLPHPGWSHLPKLNPHRKHELLNAALETWSCPQLWSHHL